MTKAKKQHWAPRFYLKEFSTLESQNKKESQVWIFSKIEGDPQIVNIKDIAAKRYLYSPQDLNGNRSWEMEEKLASLEGLISNLWPTFTNEYIDLDNKSYRKAISLFLATLLLRHPARLSEYEKLQNWLIDLYNTLPKDKNGTPNVSHFITSKGEFELDTSGWEKYSNSTEYDKQIFFVETIENSAIQIAEIFMKKRWSVIFSESKQFITTDNPLIISNHITGEVKNYGLNTKGTTITLPISPTRVLILDDLYDEPSSQYYPLKKDTAITINLVSWTNAHQFMISHRDPDEVSYEMVKYADAQTKK